MKEKHLKIRIAQCLELAKASNCPRRKFGALLLDPERNVVLMDGYNGGPRGEKGDLCGGSFCAREGFKEEDLRVGNLQALWLGPPLWVVYQNGENGPVLVDEKCFQLKEEAEEHRQGLLLKYLGVKSGTHMEVGCHHAEMNVICNAAARGVSTAGALLIVTGEPCMMCAKMIHHAGITQVTIVAGGYAGGRDGVDYLNKFGVSVTEVDGPQDPRLTAKKETA